MVTYRQPFQGCYPITQAYGEVIPGVTYQGRPHTGIDYGCPEGTPILASAAGIVMLAEFDKTGYGNTVIIQHNDGQATLYAHLSMISVVLRQKVQQGQVIGFSGSTGNCTGPHLHFEVRKIWADFRSHIDPMTLPLKNFADAGPEQLKPAEAFHAGDLLKITAPNGAKAFYNTTFTGCSSYLPGSLFYFTGETAVNKNNGLTYMRLTPAMFSVWIAANDGDCQILDNSG